MSRGLTILVAVLADGLRYVTLPDKPPEKVSIVLEYPAVTVRHEFVPDASRLAMRCDSERERGIINDGNTVLQ